MSLETLSQSTRLAIFDSIPVHHYLSIHLHEVVYSFVFYNAIFLVCPYFGKLFFGTNYTLITNRKLKLNFDIHMIAMVQALISIAFCVPLLWTGSKGIHAIDAREPVLFGYDYTHGFLSAITVGYFTWDLVVCVLHFDLFGFEFLLHAFASWFVFNTFMVPIFQYWAPRFLIFELSSPFVNINWFIANSKAKSGWLASTKVNVINGITLMVTFFSTRIVWGFWAVYLALSYIYQSWDVMTLAEKAVCSCVVGLNLSLDVLNLVWFLKMVKIAKKLARGNSKTNKKKNE